MEEIEIKRRKETRKANERVGEGKVKRRLKNEGKRRRRGNVE